MADLAFPGTAGQFARKPFKAEVVSGIRETAYQNGYCRILVDAQADSDRVIAVVS